MRVRVLGDAPMAQSKQEVPVGGRLYRPRLLLRVFNGFFFQGMNEHAIYEAVGQKRQRYVSDVKRLFLCHEVLRLFKLDRRWLVYGNNGALKLLNWSIACGRKILSIGRVLLKSWKNFKILLRLTVELTVRRIE